MTDNGSHAPEQLTLTEIPDDQIVPALGAVLFSSGQPAPLTRLARVLGRPAAEIRNALDDLSDHLVPLGLVLQRHPWDSFAIATAPPIAPVIERYLGVDRATRLSRAALEVVAIVAYRQPVTRAVIESIRGVDSSGVLQTLLARELIEPIGRLPGPGNPIQYAITPLFLDTFGLTSLDDLPELPDDLRAGVDAGDEDADEPDSEAGDTNPAESGNAPGRIDARQRTDTSG
jgi:segregation and condensation protein B